MESRRQAAKMGLKFHHVEQFYAVFGPGYNLRWSSHVAQAATDRIPELNVGQ